MGKNNKIHPHEAYGGKENLTDIEMQKFSARGIDLEHIDDEEKQWEILQTLKSIPSPMKVKVQMRDKLFAGPVKGLSGCGACSYHMKQSWRRFTVSVKELGYQLELWGKSFRGIEGHHGTGVLSYFVFLRWLLGLNFLLFLLLCGLTTIPMVLLPTVDYSTTSTDTLVNLSYVCTSNYKVNISTDAASLVLDFFQGSGWMEQTSMFYGHYAGTNLLVGTPAIFTFDYNLPLAYILVSSACLIISLFLMARHTAKSFQESVVNESDSSFHYCNKVFGSWDFALCDEKVVKIKHKSIHYDIASGLSEERFETERAMKMEDGCQMCRLYTIRILINFFVLCCLGGAAYLIYYVTAWSASYTSTHSAATGTNAYLLLLVQYLPSITITALNAGIPLIFDIIVLAEEYSQAFIVKITLIRTIFLKLASLAVLVVTLYTEISCTPRDVCGTGTSPCSLIQCWETYVGQQFYKLVVLNFLVTVLMVFCVEFPRRFITSKVKWKLVQKIGPPEFDIPKNVLDLVYTQAICWMGFFFAPLTPALVVIHLFIIFYVKQLSALFACQPSGRPYRASRSNTFFMVVLLLAFFLCSFPVVYTMADLSPSKGCGPFRIYSNMYTIIDVTIDGWPTVLNSIYSVITNPAFIVSLIILLCLMIYYCSALSSAHKDMNKLMKEQLVFEGHDKQFLLAKIRELTGDSHPMTKDRKKPHRHGEPSVDPVSKDVTGERLRTQTTNLSKEGYDQTHPHTPFD